MILEILITLFLVIGGLFTLIGSYGLLKLDDPMKRLHAPTKISTLGVGGVLAASIINAFATGKGSLHELLVIAFLFVTAPVSAHFIAKAHIHRNVDRTRLPAPPRDANWAVLQPADPVPETPLEGRGSPRRTPD